MSSSLMNQLQICCILGVQVYTGVKFQSLLEPEDDQGWHARYVQGTYFRVPFIRTYDTLLVR